MELKLQNGNYVPGGAGGFETVTGAQELLQRVLMKLMARRGALPMIPELGSRLYLLGREKAGQRSAAVQEYVAEALSEEPEIQLADVVLSYPVTGEILVQVYFDYKGQRLLAQVEV